MKKILSVVILAIASISSYAQSGSWTGYIGDSKCGVKGNNAEHAKCAVKCVKEGADPVLVVGDKVYKIEDTKKVTDFIGKKVTVTGSVDGETVKIEEIKAAK